MGAPHTARVYIVSQTSLFAQGIRSLLGAEPSVEILGVESDPARAVESARSLRPDVIIVEDPAEQGQWERLGPFIRQATAGRILALNLNHEYVTVYDHQRVEARGPPICSRRFEALAVTRTDLGIARARSIRKHEANAEWAASDLAKGMRGNQT